MRRVWALVALVLVGCGGTPSAPGVVQADPGWATQTASAAAVGTQTARDVQTIAVLRSSVTVATATHPPSAKLVATQTRAVELTQVATVLASTSTPSSTATPGLLTNAQVLDWFRSLNLRVDPLDSYSNPSARPMLRESRPIIVSTPTMILYEFIDTQSAKDFPPQPNRTSFRFYTKRNIVLQCHNDDEMRCQPYATALAQMP